MKTSLGVAGADGPSSPAGIIVSDSAVTFDHTIEAVNVAHAWSADPYATNILQLLRAYTVTKDASHLSDLVKVANVALGIRLTIPL